MVVGESIQKLRSLLKAIEMDTNDIISCKYCGVYFDCNIVEMVNGGGCRGFTIYVCPCCKKEVTVYD